MSKITNSYTPMAIVGVNGLTVGSYMPTLSVVIVGGLTIH